MTDRSTAPLAAYLDALAAPTPAPGGGSAAAVLGAMAAALVEMVAGLSLAKSPDGEHAAAQHAAFAAAERHRAALTGLAADDEAAYGAFIAALRLGKSTDAERAARTAAISRAAQWAAEVPLATVVACAEVAEASASLDDRSLASAASDLEIARRFAHGAAHAAAENVEANLPYIEEAEARARLAAACAAALDRVDRHAAAHR